MNPNIQIKSVPLAANGVVTIDAAGSYLLFTSNTGTFNFSIDGGPWQPGLSIMQINVGNLPALVGSVQPPPTSTPSFQSILLQDTSGSANTIGLIVSNSPINYIAPPIPNQQVQNAPTKLVGTGVFSLLGGHNVDFPGTATASGRKQFIVYNQDASNTLQILDVNGLVAGVVLPQSSWTIEVGGDVKVYNPNGASVVYVVSEVYYTP